MKDPSGIFYSVGSFFYFTAFQNLINGQAFFLLVLAEFFVTPPCEDKAPSGKYF